MKTKLLLFFSTLLLLSSCTSNKNSKEFINETSGRYFFNADEVIEVHFKNAELFLRWRNSDLKPLKVNDSTFYAKELNEKLIFIPSEKKIKLAEKREHEGEKFTFLKLKEREKTPSEYLAENNYEMALKGYLAIKKRDSLSPVIRQRSLNRTGYRLLANDETEKAILVFKINTQLYPKSSNTYDSLGDAYRKAKDTIKAIENYKKALGINPENRSSKRNLERLTKAKTNE
ncbi:tetratricopeptide repeat protein [Tenacibaculum amylolyticum]|uniref:tetratricopeptide repeat protein n=1 Tax=Tenacibaculum amylolyticum TaxID=104269 RepID=UPI003893CADD